MFSSGNFRLVLDLEVDVLGLDVVELKRREQGLDVATSPSTSALLDIGCGSLQPMLGSCSDCRQLGAVAKWLARQGVDHRAA